MAASGEIDRNGWLLIAGCTLGVAVCVIPVSILSLGVFMKPLGAEFGWGRAEISFALTILSVGMAGALPVAGRLIDRFGVRIPLLASLLLYGGGILLIPTLLDNFGLPAFYGIALWLGITGAASSSVAYVNVLSAWFDRSRGLALGFAMSGIAVGGATSPVLAATLIDSFDWRAGFYGLAMLPLLIGIPIGLFLQEAPSAKAARRTREAQLLPGVTATQASRMPIFWVLFALFLIAATAIHGIQIHLAPLLSDRGLSPDMAALGMTFMFGISAAVRLIAGYSFDRIFAPRVGAFCFFAACLGAALLVPDSSPMVYLFAVALLGMGAGAESDLLAMLVSRYFGLRSFGTIFGWICAAFMVGSAIGPWFLGIGFDSTGSYGSSLMWCAVGLALTTVILIALPRFPTWQPEPEEKLPPGAVTA
jgi:MFS family permease